MYQVWHDTYLLIIFFCILQAILQDLFPGIVIPEHDYGLLQTEIISVMESKNLQPIPTLVRKVIQFYETIIVRHGVMLVGPTGGGKTTVYNVSFCIYIVKTEQLIEL